MNNQTFNVLIGRDVPDFFNTDTVMLRVFAFIVSVLVVVSMIALATNRHLANRHRTLIESNLPAASLAREISDESLHIATLAPTFSKIDGLGGLRIGWGYGPQEMIDVMTRIRQPFNLSVVQLAAAEAAVRDRKWVADCAALNARQRQRLVGALGQLGIACDPSETNFVLARLADEAEAASAEKALLDAGIIIRRVGGYGLPDAIRMTIGTEEACRGVVAAVGEYLKA